MSKVEYHPVSLFQKCVWCAKVATQEVVEREGNVIAISRCCDDPKCLSLSAERCERTFAA
jgi:hypothetical protein